MLLLQRALHRPGSPETAPGAGCPPARGVRPSQNSTACLLALLLPAAADGSKARICEYPCSLLKMLRKEADTEKTAQGGLGQLQTRHRRFTPHPPPPLGRTHPKAEHHRGLQRSTDSLLPKGTVGPNPMLGKERVWV